MEEKGDEPTREERKQRRKATSDADDDDGEVEWNGEAPAPPLPEETMKRLQAEFEAEQKAAQKAKQKAKRIKKGAKLFVFSTLGKDDDVYEPEPEESDDDYVPMSEAEMKRLGPKKRKEEELKLLAWSAKMAERERKAQEAPRRVAPVRMRKSRYGRPIDVDPDDDDARPYLGRVKDSKHDNPLLDLDLPLTNSPQDFSVTYAQFMRELVGHRVIDP